MRLLERNGTVNTSVDGAEFNRFCSGGRNGIIKGVADECEISVLNSNTIQVSKGQLLIDGFRIDLDEPIEFSFSTFPSETTRYQIIGQIDLDDNKQPTFSCFYQVPTTPVQNNLFSSSTTTFTHQVEIGRFSVTTSSVEDCVTTLDVINGGTGSVSETGSGDFEIGTITTQKIDYSLDAEVDVNKRTEDNKNYIDFTFSLPVDISDLTKTASKLNYDTETNTLYIYSVTED